MNYHTHHIIPRHRGGTDDKDNLVRITTTQHAMFHYTEWRLWGHREDYIAWKALCGSLKAGELSAEKEALRIARMKGKKRTPEQCKRISEAAKNRKKTKRGPYSVEHRESMKRGHRSKWWGEMTDEEIKEVKREQNRVKSRRLRALKGHT